MTTRLLIARHGNTFAPGDTVTRVGTTDLPLVTSGLQQARQLGLYLQEKGWFPDVIFTSELQRTRQTAEQIQAVLHTELTLNPLASFNEIDYGPDENRPETEVIARIGKHALEAWETQSVVPDGWQVDPQKIIANWQQFAVFIEDNYAEQTNLVITSNGIARFAPHLTGDYAAFSQHHSSKIATGALCVFEKEATDSVWRCMHWNIRPCLTLTEA